MSPEKSHQPSAPKSGVADAPGRPSRFAQHVTEVVNGLMLGRDRTATAQALIRERAAEARHLAERLRIKAAEFPVLATVAVQLDERAALLDGVAEKWGRS
jgi:hypothetical protein